MTLEWIPSNLNGAASNQGTSGLINQLWVFEDVNTINTNSYTDAAIVKYDSFRAYDPTKAFTIIRDNRTLAR